MTVSNCAPSRSGFAAAPTRDGSSPSSLAKVRHSERVSIIRSPRTVFGFSESSIYNIENQQNQVHNLLRPQSPHTRSPAENSSIICGGEILQSGQTSLIL